MSLLQFKLIISSMLFTYGSGQQQIDDNEKCRWIAGNFDCHADGAAVRYRAHHPIEHIPGFSRSHWMPPSGKCLRRIAPVAAMVNKFVEPTQNTNKTQLLASNYGTFWWLVVCENFIPRYWPSTQLTIIRSCVKNVRHPYWSWRARAHFQLSNIVRGQNFKKVVPYLRP